jgi:hypothetical protein
MRNFSKSKLIAFRQCPKRLWLEIHRPQLREDSANTEASFQVGYAVGDVARKIYDPENRGHTIDVKGEGYGAAFARSEALLANSSQPVFEAGLRCMGALAFADVMLPEIEGGERAWRMVEVKSSTSVKDYHRDDIAVQTFIAHEGGVNLKSVAVACIDSSWVYPGGEDYRGLLAETDLSAETFARSEEVRGWLAEAQRVAAEPNEPVVSVGDQCHVPFDCGFCNYCNRDKPKAEYSVDLLPKLTAKQRRLLVDQGIDDLRQVPDELLNDKQAIVKQHTLENTVYHDAPGSMDDLAAHGLPALFLDFETIQFAVPIWKGTRPYQQIPFQFSVHALAADGGLTHEGFLDLSGRDPSEEFARALIAAGGGDGPIFVYNAAFEMTRIRELAARFPNLAEPLTAINGRIVDLLPIARERYYHPSQRGSWSIKAVLPAVAPDLRYDALTGVQDGGGAMVAYCEAIRPGTTVERKAEIEGQLIDYCRLDTFAMVRLWKFFSGSEVELG